MVVTGEADRRKATVWTGLEALGRSRPDLLLEGEAATYLARWRSSPVPARVLAWRLRAALPGSTVVRVRSWPTRGGVVGPDANGRLTPRHGVAIEFALGPEPVASEPDVAETVEEEKPCVEG